MFRATQAPELPVRMPRPPRPAPDPTALPGWGVACDASYRHRASAMHALRAWRLLRNRYGNFVAVSRCSHATRVALRATREHFVLSVQRFALQQRCALHSATRCRVPARAWCKGCTTVQLRCTHTRACARHGAGCVSRSRHACGEPHGAPGGRSGGVPRAHTRFGGGVRPGAGGYI